MPRTGRAEMTEEHNDAAKAYERLAKAYERLQAEYILAHQRCIEAFADLDFETAREQDVIMERIKPLMVEAANEITSKR